MFNQSNFGVHFTHHQRDFINQIKLLLLENSNLVAPVCSDKSHGSSRAMLLIEVFFGHSASQARVLVQLPNPSSSIFDQHSFCRLKSGLPCGNVQLTNFCETNNIAEPFLHAATQAPQPIQTEASIASSAIGFKRSK